MSTISATVQHNGQELRGEYMTIKSTFLGREDHGFLTFTLSCVGGYALDSAPTSPGWSRVPTPLFLMRPFCSRGRALGHGVAGRRVPH